MLDFWKYDINMIKKKPMPPENSAASGIRIRDKRILSPVGIQIDHHPDRKFRTLSWINVLCGMGGGIRFRVPTWILFHDD